MQKRIFRSKSTIYHLPLRLCSGPSASTNSGFSLVELIIVIAIIAILATLGLASYNVEIQNSTSSSLQSGLKNASKQLVVDQIRSSTGVYPATLAAANSGAGISFSSGATVAYNVDNTDTPKTFCLSATQRGQSYFITQESNPMPGPCPVLYLDAGIQNSYPGTGTAWGDLSGLVNNGTMYGGVTYSSSNGGFMNFDGTNDYVSINDSNTLDFSTGDFSFSYWIYVPTYISTTDRERGVVNKNVSYENSAGWGSEIILYNPSQSNFVINAYNTGQIAWNNTNVSSGNLSTNMWHNIYCKREGGTLYLYDDAVLKGSNNNINVSINVDNNQPIIIGDHSWGLNYPGSLSDIRIYNRTLTSTEITQNHNALKSRYGL